MTSSVSDFEKVLHLLQQNLEESQNDNLTLQAQIDELKDQSRELGKDNDYLRNKIAGIQQDNSIYSNTQSRLETQLYDQEQDTNDLRKQIQQLTKAKKDADHKLQMELSNFETDRAAWQQKEADMYNQIRTLNAGGGEPRTPRTPHRRSATSSTLAPFGFPAPPLSNIGEDGNDRQPKLSLSSSTSTSHLQKKRNSRLLLNNNDDDEEDDDLFHSSGLPSTPKLATIDSSFVRESKIAQRTIKAQDKLILDLKVEMDQQKSIVQDRDAQSQRQSLRIQHLEQEIANVKQVNQSLMEDNESYQILLHEKTISGEFMMNPIMQVEKTEASSDITQSSTSTNANGGGGLNLAAELNLANDFEATQKANEVDIAVQKLTDEVKTLQDTNRALQLYMNKILMKIIDNKQLEDVLSIDQPKPRPLSMSISTTTANKDTNVEPAPRSAGLGPAPTRTLSSTLLNKGTATRQQRRRTISYWGSKAPAPPPLPNNSDKKDLPSVPETSSPSSTVDPSLDDHTHRRHSAMPSSGTSSNSNTNSGWAKAFRRMSIGWSASPTATTSTASNKTLDDSLKTSTPPASLHPSTSSSSSSNEDNGTLDSQRISNINRPLPSMSRSASSTTSLRASNELATLQEE
ncbi:unnamed protein product [Absidia cylindrospora]